MRNSKKLFYTPRSTLDKFSIMPLTAMYNYCIDRRKLTEQKKSVAHIVLPSLIWVGTKMFCHHFRDKLVILAILPAIIARQHVI